MSNILLDIRGDIFSLQKSAIAVCWEARQVCEAPPELVVIPYEPSGVLPRSLHTQTKMRSCEQILSSIRFFMNTTYICVGEGRGNIQCS